jgi:hypothetical protein
MRHFFRGGWEKRPKGNIIRASLSRLHREVTAIMAGNANLRLTAQNLARLTRIAIILAQMHAIRTQTLGERNAVIDDEGNVALGTNHLQRLCRARNGVIVQPLQPQLKGRNRPRIQRGFQPIRDTIVKLWGGQQIEFRWLPVFRGKSFGKALRHFWQVKIIHAGGIGGAGVKR